MIKRILSFFIIFFAAVPYQCSMAQMLPTLRDRFEAEQAQGAKYIYTSSSKIYSLKQFGDSIKMIVQLSDTSMIVSVNNFLRNFIVTYKEGLGFTDLSFFREGDHTTKTVKLVCYTKNNVSVGDCSILDKILSNAAKEESEGISIYPNPAIEQITISPISENAEGNKVSIYNSLGRKVYNKNLMQGVSSHSINIENFIPGLYYAEIQGKNLVRKSFVKY